MNKKEKLEEATIKALQSKSNKVVNELSEAKLFEDKKFSIEDISTKSTVDYPWIINYRVGKTGVRFTGVYYINDEDDEFRLECHVNIDNNGEISSKFETNYSSDYTIDNLVDPDAFVSMLIDQAVKKGYIEQKDGIYVDKKETEKNKAKSEFLNMVDLSNEELKNNLPGKSVQGLNSDHIWKVLGIFTAYNGKDYVAMKKEGSFADPNIVELNRFKKSYKLF